MKNCIDALKTSGAKIICYGASGGGTRALKFLTENGIKVDFFADTYNHNNLFHGIKTLSPDELVEYDKHESLEIIITTEMYRIIYEYLINKGIQGRIWSMPLYTKFEEDTPTLLHPEVNKLFNEEISFIRSNLIDCTSQEILDLLTAARLNCSPNAYLEACEISISVSGNKQYLPHELHSVLIKRPISFVDCGACTGDTIEEMINWGISFAKCWCFEPDNNVFKTLCDNINRLGLCENFQLLKSCVYSTEKNLSLQISINGSSHITNNENCESVPAIVLDKFLAGNHIDFIKMDIESSEMEALYGAEHIIEICRPLLAICIYHRYSDLTKIPIHLINKLTNYKYMLRHYSKAMEETIFYAIPNDMWNKI